MSRPKTVTFGAVTWRIKYTRDLGERRGQTDQAEHRIDLATYGMQPLAKRKTLVHELVHAALTESPVTALPAWEDSLEEAVCLALEGPILELFQRRKNRGVRRWLSR